MVSGGARGADLLVNEQALERGARIRLCLALPPDEFEQRSVALPGTDWASRFRRVLDHADVEVVGSREQADDVFVRANMRIVEVARTLAAGTPRAIVVWDGRAGDGPGGTRDFVERVGYERPGEDIRVIDPTRRAYEARQPADGPKTLLAPDGGGNRGVLSVEILAALESKLRERHDPGLVLADCFDELTLGDPEFRSLLLIVLHTESDDQRRSRQRRGPRRTRVRLVVRAGLLDHHANGCVDRRDRGLRNGRRAERKSGLLLGDEAGSLPRIARPEVQCSLERTQQRRASAICAPVIRSRRDAVIACTRSSLVRVG